MMQATHPLLAHAAGPTLLPYLDNPHIREIRVTSTGRCFVIHSTEGKQRMPDMDPASLNPFLALCASLMGTG
jgi:hypothetical protein